MSGIMKYKILLSFLLFFFLLESDAQQQSDRRNIRIVDTLTTQERNNRNPVILKAELDSMIQSYNASQPQTQLQEPVKEIVNKIPLYVTGIGLGALLIIAFLLYLLLRNQKKFGRIISGMKRQIQNLELYATSDSTANTFDRNTKSKMALEKKIAELTADLDNKIKQNQLELEEYQLVKETIADVYKVRNYPGFDKEKDEGQIITGLLSTEKSVAIHAFEKFLKPIIQLTDANKNNPAKISKEDSDKLLELLVSLSLYYIEYLYLRINELSVGGNIVQRIGGTGNGNGIDRGLLKKLNTEHGSRALTLRMALNKAGIDKLSYPVFDDTDLNNS
jgi:hypothetical protein